MYDDKRATYLVDYIILNKKKPDEKSLQGYSRYNNTITGQARRGEERRGDRERREWGKVGRKDESLNFKQKNRWYLWCQSLMMYVLSATTTIHLLRDRREKGGKSLFVASKKYIYQSTCLHMRDSPNIMWSIKLTIKMFRISD